MVGSIFFVIQITTFFGHLLFGPFFSIIWFFLLSLPLFVLLILFSLIDFVYLLSFFSCLLLSYLFKKIYFLTLLSLSLSLPLYFIFGDVTLYDTNLTTTRIPCNSISIRAYLCHKRLVLGFQIACGADAYNFSRDLDPALKLILIHNKINFWSC